MSLSDPIADMLTRIRNAQLARKKEVAFSFSKIKHAISSVLQDEGYINSFSTKEIDNKKYLSLELKYYSGSPVIETIKRISKPGMRIYKPVAKMPDVLGGLGICIVSTSKGVMTGKNKKKLGIGGEIICEVV